MKESKLDRALKDCIEIWDELAETGADDKASISKDLSNFLNDCPACEYVKETFLGKEMVDWGWSGAVWDYDAYPLCAKLCPLQSLWPGGCEEDGALYERWMCAEDELNRKVLAKQIADGARAALAKFNKR